jgi:photosystem II stability/assembly factor-like uncharacterized protein
MSPSRLVPIAACLASALFAQQAARPAQPRLTYERFFGGRNSDIPTSVTTDLQANVIVVGTTDSVDFPTTPGSYKPAVPGPLQARHNDAAAFQSIRLGPVERVNTIAFSASGSVGYADAASISGDDAIYRTVDSGRTWQLTATHLPYNASLLVIDPSTPSTVYALSAPSLYKSMDAGDTWTKAIYPSQNNYPPSFLAIDATDSNRLFLILGYMPSRVLRSIDGGITWQQLSTGLPYNANAIAIDPNQPSVVYSAGSFENVFRSQDGGDTWTQLLPGTSPSFVRAQLTVDSSSVLYATASAGIYRSMDRGETYTFIPTPNGAILDKFQIDPRDGSHFLLSTSFNERYSLFESHDSGATWSGLSLAVPSVSGIAIRGDSLFVVTPPARQVFVTKWNSLTGAIFSATYLGPSQLDAPPRVVTDRNGYVYVSGETSGNGFPVTPGALLTTPGPNVSRVGFVAKLSPDLSQLVWSTLVGGGFGGPQFQPPTYISDLQVDGTGSVYVAGVSCSPDFPAKTIGSGQASSNGGTSYSISCGSNPGGAFVAKLNPSGTATTYATYLDGAERASALALDASGSVYLAGPVANRIGPGFQGLDPRGPSFLAKIAPAGDRVEFFAKLDANASATSIALAPSGDVLVTGATNTSLLPGFEGAFQISPTRQTCNSGADAYVLRTTPDLRFTAFSFLGDGCEEGESVRADRYGNIWVSGFSGSTKFPQQSGYQSAGQGFVAELTPNASALLYLSKVDFPPQLNVSREGSVFLASSTDRFGAPTTIFSSGGTALLTRIDP